MRDERGEVDAAVAHELHEPSHPLLPAWAERGHDLLVADAVDVGLDGYLELSPVDPEARDDAAGAGRLETRLEGLLGAECLDRDVDAAAPGEPLDRSHRILLREVDHVGGAHLTREMEALLD